MQIPDIAHFKSGLYLLLLNNKEFRFFLLGLNSIFSTLSQSEFTSREVYSGLCLYLSIVYSVFQRCPTRDEISFPVGQSNCKKGPLLQIAVIISREKAFTFIPYWVVIAC